MVQDSVETWRLYSAEASVRITTPLFADVEATRQYVANVQTST